MIFKLAIYDSTNSVDGTYWGCHHPDISLKKLDQLYAWIVRNGDLSDLNAIGKSFRIGCALFDEHIGFLYRIFALRTSRLQSWIYVFAFDRKEAVGYDILTIFDNISVLNNCIEQVKNTDGELYKSINLPVQLEYEADLPLWQIGSADSITINKSESKDFTLGNVKLKPQIIHGTFENFKKIISVCLEEETNLIASFHSFLGEAQLHYLAGKKQRPETLKTQNSTTPNALEIECKENQQGMKNQVGISKKHQKMLFIILGCLILVLIGWLVMPTKPSLQDERDALLRDCRKQFEKVSKNGQNDLTQVGMTGTAGSMWDVAETALSHAAALRLRISPEDAEIILQDIYSLARIIERIDYDNSDEFLGSAEPMRRYVWIASLIKRQIEIFLAPPEIYSLWKRVRSATGVVRNQSFSLVNGRSFLHTTVADTFENDEILLNAELCFSYKDTDYAILSVDIPKAMSSENRGSYLVRIKQEKIKILEEFGEFYVEKIEVKNDQLIIFGQQPLNDKEKTETKIVNLKKI